MQNFYFYTMYLFFISLNTITYVRSDLYISILNISQKNNDKEVEIRDYLLKHLKLPYIRC